MKREKNLESVVAIAAGLLVCYVIFGTKTLLLITLAILLIGVFSSFLSEKIAWLWMKLAMGLGWINSKILLGIVFYVILTPIAWFYRLAKKNPRNTDRTSMFVDRNHQYVPKDFENTW